MTCDFAKCQTCGEYAWLSTHRCAPVWEARILDPKCENDWVEVHGIDAESAAAKFAEEYDQNGDYDIVRRGSEEVEVRKLGDEVVIIVDVEAESVPQYRAWARKEPATPSPQGSAGS